jgi:hypothetical protein
MRHLLATAFVVAVAVAASVPSGRLMAQTPQEQVPREVLAAWRSKLQRPLTLEQPINDSLQNTLKFLSDRFDVRIRIDEAAFQNKPNAINKAVGDQGVWLPKQSEVPMGVVLGALVGQVGGSYQLTKDGILVIPAPKETTLVQRLFGPGKNRLLERSRLLSVRSKEATALREKLTEPITLKAIDTNTALQDFVEYMVERFKLNVIIDDWAFKSIDVDALRDQPITMPRLERVPLRTLLEHLCKQINGTYIILDNMVVIVPRSGGRSEN